MAKRFTDNEKWKKTYFKGLSTVNKLFFLYVLDDCDHAGIWHCEKEIAEIRIGEKIDIELAKKQLGKHIVEFDDGEKWFIPAFIEFQYGELNPNVNAHKSVIQKLTKKKLMNLNQLLMNSSLRVMDKDKDMDKDKEQREFESFWNLYDKKVSKQKSIILWQKLKQFEKDAIMGHIPRYKKSQPDKIYRKNPDVYLRNRSWEDEIIMGGKVENRQSTVEAITYICPECDHKLKRDDKEAFFLSCPKCRNPMDVLEKHRK